MAKPGGIDHEAYTLFENDMKDRYFSPTMLIRIETKTNSCQDEGLSHACQTGRRGGDLLKQDQKYYSWLP